jgi:pimeloyl-ACP methyl ester carboxylesterase
MEDCVAGGAPAVCGKLSVPEDRSNPTGRRIDLNVAVIPAESAAPDADPLFPLDGGPGQAATEDLAWTASAFDRIHAERDIVLVDQRGTGGSNALVVVGEAPDTTGLTDAEANRKIEAWRDKVIEALPGDPRFYTTSAAMDDLDDVRAALGYESINLYGPSYGATAALYYLRQHEDRVRTVVLDGGTLLDVPIFERMAPNSQHALDVLITRCAADVACASAYPDLRGDLRAALTELRRHAVTTSALAPGTSEPLVIDEMLLTASIHSALLDVQTLGSVPRLIHEAGTGAWERVAPLVAAGMDPPQVGGGLLVMAAEIRCFEHWARFDPKETALAAADSYLRDVQVQSARDWATRCRYAPQAVIPANDGDAVTSDRPVLITLGEADPQDPLPNVADAPADFPNSLTIVVPGQAHTVAHLGCMPSIVESFIEAGTVVGLDASCAATDVPLPPFDTAP